MSGGKQDPIVLSVCKGHHLKITKSLAHSDIAIQMVNYVANKPNL
jgi:hypothetical protein